MLRPHPTKARPPHIRAIDLPRITRREIFLSFRPQSRVGGNAAPEVACQAREYACREKHFLAAESAPEERRYGLQPRAIPLLRLSNTPLALLS
jgi:hypothetical protein